MLGSGFGSESGPSSGLVLTCMPVNVERAFNGVLILSPQAHKGRNLIFAFNMKRLGNLEIY